MQLSHRALLLFCKPAILDFAGKFKAVTAGFVYFADAAGTKAVLNLRGRHVFKGGKGDFAWQTIVGFTETSFDAKVIVRDRGVTAGHVSVHTRGSCRTTSEGPGRRAALPADRLDLQKLMSSASRSMRA